VGQILSIHLDGCITSCLDEKGEAFPLIVWRFRWPMEHEITEGSAAGKGRGAVLVWTWKTLT